MKRLILQLIAVAILAAGVYGAWVLLAEPEAREESRASMEAAVPVSVARARSDRVAERVEAVGTTRAWEAVEVVAPVAGRITAIHFEEGEEVEQGRLLFELQRDREEAELREATAVRDDIASQLRRARELLRSQNVAEARVDELHASLEGAEARMAALRAALEDKQVRAPFGGVVGLREVSPGAFVQPQQRLTTLDDLSKLRLEFSVPERFLGVLAADLAVEARSAAFPEQSFEGQIKRMDSRVDPVTRSVRLQAELTNEDRRLRPGMFMAISLTVAVRDDAVLVPESAVVTEGDSSYVFVIEEGEAERRAVELGERLVGEVEIRSGLAVDEQVAILGLQRLRDGIGVRIVDSATGV